MIRLQHTLSPSPCAKKQWVMRRDHNIQFCWSLSRDINNSYRRARTYSPEPSITLQNIHKSVINPSKIPRIFYTNWQSKNNNTRAEKMRLQNDENHNNWFSKLPYACPRDWGTCAFRQVKVTCSCRTYVIGVFYTMLKCYLKWDIRIQFYSSKIVSFY